MLLQQSAGALVASLGIQLQLAGSMLCLGLGLILRRGIGHRPWMTWWAWSFGAVALGVAALLARYEILPLLPLGSLQEHETQYVRVLYATYAAAKLLFLCCLLTGTWLFVTRRRVSRVDLGAGTVFILLVTALFALAPTDLNPLMAWQAGYNVPVFVACVWLLARLPAAHRTRGSRALAVVCICLAGLWILYIPAFLGAPADSNGVNRGLLGWLTQHNSYVDVLFEFLLGFGMILAVLDDVYREAELARVARLNELADSEARLAQIIRAASDGIVLLDAERRIMHCNPAALDILGCGAEAVLGQPFDRFARRNELEPLWGRSAGDERPPHTPPGGYEIHGLRADGAEFPMELSLRAIGKAQPEGYVLILRDRTQRARLEEERDRMQAQLAHTARMETIGRMVSGVAHELNNPLTAILAFGQDLLSQPRSLADTEALSTIVQQSQRCRAIVQDLLSFARTKREDRQSVTLLEIANRVLPAFEREAVVQDIRLEVQVDAELPPIHANPAAMEQVLTNLLSNAFQAIGSGGTVELRAELVGDRLALMVEDTGPGVAGDVLPRLFEPFFTTKSPGEGTGLGLSVSHGIVEQHGGTLRAENRSGPGMHGARFTVVLPFLDRRCVRRSAPLELPTTDLAARAPATGAAVRRVLVVDDEAAIRVAIRRYLERRGWVVEEARNGQEALEILGLDNGAAGPRTGEYDAIVTDLRMPGVTGIDIHDRLASADPASLQKLVVISGDTASTDIADFVARLRRPIVQKPFDMRALADLLDRTAPPGAASAAP